MTLELKQWMGRGCWAAIAVFFGWVAVCAAAAAETIMLPGIPDSGGMLKLGSTVGTPIYGLLNWGVPGVMTAVGTLAVLARQRVVPIERVVIMTSLVLAMTAGVVTLGGSFCREVLGTASLSQSVWWMIRV